MTQHFNRADGLSVMRVNEPAPYGACTDTRPLEVSVDKAGSKTRLVLRGTLNTVSASAYDSIIAAAEAPCCQLHLDLSGLNAATRAGCRAIHIAAKLMHRRGYRVAIYAARPNVAAAMRNTGFDNLMDFHNGSAPPVHGTSATGQQCFASAAQFAPNDTGNSIEIERMKK